METENMSICNMNSTRSALGLLPRSFWKQNQTLMLKELKPDLCVLHRDKDGECAAPCGYRKYKSPTDPSCTVLYNENKVSVEEQEISSVVYNDLVDPSLIDCALVRCLSLKPVRHELKSFIAISVSDKMFEKLKNKVKEGKVRNLINFAQSVALFTGRPIIIVGEILLPFEFLRRILVELNTKRQEVSMVEGLTRETRRLFKLNAVEAESLKNEAAASFIASQSLEMKKAEAIAIKKFLGELANTTALNSSFATYSQISIPVRPPRHSGG